MDRFLSVWPQSTPASEQLLLINCSLVSLRTAPYSEVHSAICSLWFQAHSPTWWQWSKLRSHQQDRLWFVLQCCSSSAEQNVCFYTSVVSQKQPLMTVVETQRDRLNVISVWVTTLGCFPAPQWHWQKSTDVSSGVGEQPDCLCLCCRSDLYTPEPCVNTEHQLTPSNVAMLEFQVWKSQPKCTHTRANISSNSFIECFRSPVLSLTDFHDDGDPWPLTSAACCCSRLSLLISFDQRTEILEKSLVQTRPVPGSDSWEDFLQQHKKYKYIHSKSVSRGRKSHSAGVVFLP